MQNPEDDNLRSLIFNMVSSGAENAVKVETDLLRANPRVFPGYSNMQPKREKRWVYGWL